MVRPCSWRDFGADGCPAQFVNKASVPTPETFFLTAPSNMKMPLPVDLSQFSLKIVFPSPTGWLPCAKSAMTACANVKVFLPNQGDSRNDAVRLFVLISLSSLIARFVSRRLQEWVRFLARPHTRRLVVHLPWNRLPGDSYCRDTTPGIWDCQGRRGRGFQRASAPAHRMGLGSSAIHSCAPGRSPAAIGPSEETLSSGRQVTRPDCGHCANLSSAAMVGPDSIRCT